MREDGEVLLKLFKTCLECRYEQVENGGSFSVIRNGGLAYIFLKKAMGARIGKTISDIIRSDTHAWARVGFATKVF